MHGLSHCAGRAVIELNLAGIGHYTLLRYIVGLGFQLYGVDDLARRTGTLLHHCTCLSVWTRVFSISVNLSRRVGRTIGLSSEPFAGLLGSIERLLGIGGQVISSRDLSRLCISTYFTELLTHLHASRAYSISYSYSWRDDTSTS